jgi:hypothetical protein
VYSTAPGGTMAADRQRVDIQPSKQRQSRPLRTGAEFSLVVPVRRVVMRRWEKASYRAGEEARLIVSGVGLGKEPLTLTVEAQDDRGVWSAVAKVRAEVDAEGKQAATTWTFPKAPVVSGAATVRESDGSVLSDARFEDPGDLEKEGGTAWLLARAEGFEGRSLQVVLEREEEPGKWVAVGQAVTTVKSGALRSAVTPESGKKPGA